MAKAEAIETGSFRVLRKMIPEVEFAQNVSPELDPSLIGGSGWKMEDGPGGSNVAVWRGYFDLTGYNQNDLTFIPTAVQFQEAAPFLSNDIIGSRVYDLLTKNPVTNEDIAISTTQLTAGLGLPLWIPPGFSGSLHEMEGVIQGSMRLFTVNSTLATAAGGQIAVVQGTQWGLGDATAADRLYITRVVTEPQNPAGGSEIWVPPTCVVCAGSPIEESELVYMNRLRRSFEQQWTPDVD